MNLIYTFHPEILNRGLKLKPVDIPNWRPLGPFAVESYSSSSKGFVSEVDNEQLEYLKKIVWLTHTRGNEYMHQGVLYGNKLTVHHVAKLLTISDSGAYRTLQKFFNEGELKREKIGKRYCYKIRS